MNVCGSNTLRTLLLHHFLLTVYFLRTDSYTIESDHFVHRTTKSIQYDTTIQSLSEHKCRDDTVNFFGLLRGNMRINGASNHRV